jgi:hypothetical protein
MLNHTIVRSDIPAAIIASQEMLFRFPCFQYKETTNLLATFGILNHIVSKMQIGSFLVTLENYRGE